MDELISPKYLMKLISDVEEKIWEEYNTYKQVGNYISKWHKSDWNWENFSISQKSSEDSRIDLNVTLHNMQSDLVMKIAIDLGVNTPDFIPSIPLFRNEIKANYKTAYNTFLTAFKQIESDPSTAIGLANSALESIIKEILKDPRIDSKVKGNETLYRLSIIILKEFNSNESSHPKEIKTIGTSLLTINQAIEKLRSEKTNFHGKTNDDYLIEDTIYSYFIINTVATVGLFLQSYFKKKYFKDEQFENYPPPPPISIEELGDDDDLPF